MSLGRGSGRSSFRKSQVSSHAKNSSYCKFTAAWIFKVNNLALPQGGKARKSQWTLIFSFELLTIVLVVRLCEQHACCHADDSILPKEGWTTARLFGAYAIANVASTVVWAHDWTLTLFLNFWISCIFCLWCKRAVLESDLFQAIEILVAKSVNPWQTNRVETLVWISLDI